MSTAWKTGVWHRELSEQKKKFDKEKQYEACCTLDLASIVTWDSYIINGFSGAYGHHATFFMDFAIL